MNRATIFLSLSLAATIAAGLASAQPSAQSPAAPSEPVDVRLEALRGGHLTLSAERERRTVVLFYEDRPSLELNDQLKVTLQQHIRRNHLDDRLKVWGVANLGGISSSFERAIAMRLIRAGLETYGAEIMLDWEGVLRTPPFSLATNASNVLIIDRQGRIVYREQGEITGRLRSRFFRTLRRELHR